MDEKNQSTPYTKMESNGFSTAVGARKVAKHNSANMAQIDGAYCVAPMRVHRLTNSGHCMGVERLRRKMFGFQFKSATTLAPAILG